LLVENYNMTTPSWLRPAGEFLANSSPSEKSPFIAICPRTEAKKEGKRGENAGDCMMRLEGSKQGCDDPGGRRTVESSVIMD